jgi:NAD(P)-dependent dehydrogenase (short-subunit alcohol dehydrogenase family)
LDKVLLVTGGGRGIGAATARLAGQRGYSVCVNYRQNRDSAQRVVHAIEACGARALAVAGDVSVETDVLRLFETCDSKLGTLTALVNNVGVVET